MQLGCFPAVFCAALVKSADQRGCFACAPRGVEGNQIEIPSNASQVHVQSLDAASTVGDVGKN